MISNTQGSTHRVVVDHWLVLLQPGMQQQAAGCEMRWQLLTAQDKHASAAKEAC